ncbi:hypothetical protein FXO38_29974 [Capsicum annuum]|nr:hypothetical protein FXO38_29974 [Capsicum annuum]
MNPSSIYGQAILQSKSGLGGPGLNQGVTGLLIKGWTLTGIDHLRPSIDLQVFGLAFQRYQFGKNSTPKQEVMTLQSDNRRLTNRPWPLENIGNSLGGAYVNIGNSLGGAYANIGDSLGGAYVNIGNGMGSAYVRNSGDLNTPC